MRDKSRILLVVDDESAICQLVAECFSDTDFRVLTAKDGREALAAIDACHGNIDVLLVDIVMPILNGTELARIVLSTYPDIKIIFMSGQPDDLIDRYGIPGSNMRFIKKPFDTDQLVDTVYEELAGK